MGGGAPMPKVALSGNAGAVLKPVVALEIKIATVVMAKASNATVSGQISGMLNGEPRDITTHNLENVVKNFNNVYFQIGKNSKLILDKAGLTHILGRNHPDFR
ncbi:hypothetical protein DVR12_17620 [Chitinophaga silvatica]|uniref:Uncharacterized protein n=1 Tax=Chitinophaga silvatica TaxID=2282649 RepID=A0A3E1Y7V6_9BACT|nr:hypothetical protein [Chitinophaga silvatica]RFS21154.1 hypothetical protein DVR12_17620 [Chitinophaga silvatica]